MTGVGNLADLCLIFEVFPFSVSLKTPEKSAVSKGIAMYPASDPHPLAPFKHAQKSLWGKVFGAEPKITCENGKLSLHFLKKKHMLYCYSYT